jgi:hypothetical protein
LSGWEQEDAFHISALPGLKRGLNIQVRITWSPFKASTNDDNDYLMRTCWLLPRTLRLPAAPNASG